MGYSIHIIQDVEPACFRKYFSVSRAWRNKEVWMYHAIVNRILFIETKIWIVMTLFGSDCLVPNRSENSKYDQNLVLIQKIIFLCVGHGEIKKYVNLMKTTSLTKQLH